jgi:hypothetical protein
MNEFSPSNVARSKLASSMNTDLKNTHLPWNCALSNHASSANSALSNHASSVETHRRKDTLSRKRAPRNDMPRTKNACSNEAGPSNTASRNEIAPRNSTRWKLVPPPKIVARKDASPTKTASSKCKPLVNTAFSNRTVSPQRLEDTTKGTRTRSSQALQAAMNPPRTDSRVLAFGRSVVGRRQTVIGLGLNSRLRMRLHRLNQRPQVRDLHVLDCVPRDDMIRPALQLLRIRSNPAINADAIGLRRRCPRPLLARRIAHTLCSGLVLAHRLRVSILWQHPHSIADPRLS